MSRSRAKESVLALSLVLAAAGCGSKKSDEGAGEVTVVPRPAVARVDAGSTPHLAACFDEDDCRPGQTCTGTCGVHQLGDTNCTCVDESYACTACVLNPAFKGMLEDATTFCPATVKRGGACATKGATCIAFDSDVQERTPCLCWKGKSGLEWDCDGYPTVSTPAFFMDQAPQTGTPGPPPADGGPFGGR